LGWGTSAQLRATTVFPFVKKHTVSVYEEVVWAIDLASKRGDVRKQKPLVGRNVGVQHDEITIRQFQQHSRRILHVIEAINNYEKIIAQYTKEANLFCDEGGSRSSSWNNK
jgi:hypothetical protein